MQQTERKGIVVPVRISGELAERIEMAVNTLHYRSRSEFIREAIENHTKETLDARIIEARDVTVDEAARMIDAYLSKNPGVHYVSELSEVLGIELSMAFSAAKKLLGHRPARVQHR